MVVGFGLIVAGTMAFAVTLILSVVAYEVWDSGWDYITDKVLAVGVGTATLSMFLVGLGLVIGGVTCIAGCQ